MFSPKLTCVLTYALISLMQVQIGSQAIAAEKPITIVGAGNVSRQLFESNISEVEKYVGTHLEFKQYRSPLAIANLARNVVDAYTGPRVDSFFKVAETDEKVPKQQLDDYLYTPVRETKVYAGLHPDNPVRELNHEQIRDILLGKIKNWKALNGKDLEIVVYLASDKLGIVKLIEEKYLGGSKHKAELTKDQDGQMRLLKKNPGALLFVTEPSITQEGLTLTTIPTEVGFTHYFTIKKNARPEVKKLFEYVEKNISRKLAH